MRKGGMVKGIVSVMAGALLGPASAFAAAPPAPVAAPAAVATTAPLKPYRINPGDEIEIYVWGDERLQRVLKVLPDGSVSFPLVGRIDALNKLPTDLEG
ncbi:polysaccharide biosynthesis/export family protein [Rhizorhabdus histidinilytica]